MVSEDGTKFDLGKWKIPEPEVLPKPLSFSATRTIKPIASTKTKNTRTRPFDILISSNTLPASTAETKVIQKTTSRKDQPTKSVFTSSSVTKTLCAPFPGSRNIPLKLRKMLCKQGLVPAFLNLPCPIRRAWGKRVEYTSRKNCLDDIASCPLEKGSIYYRHTSHLRNQCKKSGA